MRRLASISCIVFLIATLTWAADITVDNVVQLKHLGFSDAEVKTEIEKAGTTYHLTEADIEKLGKAGVGDELLDFMRGPESTPLTIEAIVKMVEDGRSAEEILQAVSQSGMALGLTPAQALELGRKQVPLAILLALKGRPLGVDDLKRLAETQLKEDGYVTLASLVGFSEERPTAGDALGLLQAGVPNGVVAMFREGRRPAAPVATTGGGREYRHVGKQFTLHLPPDWRVIRTLDQGTVTYAATPERGKSRADDLTVCFEVGLLHLGGAITDTDRSAVENLRHLLPLLRADEPDMELQGDIETTGLGKLPAARQRFVGNLKDKAGSFILDIYLASQDGVSFMAVCRAPSDQFASHAAAFEQIRTESEFGRPGRQPQRRALESSELVERYKQSVVSVLAHRGGGRLSSGTGFIIHPDGYVATNAHVVLDEEGRPAPRYTVQWDSGLGIKEVEADLIGWRRKREKMFFHWESDVALLKLPPGEYTATSLTPLDEVRLGDPVVAVGFPQRFHFDTLNVFVTGGVVTRFNRNREGHIDSIFTDAKIAKGSSGGPCFSRITGGVIGQNTYGMPIQGGEQGEKFNELVGYSGVIPVRYLIDRFPLVAELGLGMDPDLDFLDSYALASLLLNRHPGDDARRLAERAVKLRSDSADAHYLYGSCLLQTEGLSEALKAFNAALDADPRHMDTLLTLSQIYLGNEDLVQASQYADRAVQAHPKLWRTHYNRAQLHLTLGRYDDALRSANTAKSLARGVLAEPSILAGQILYAKGDLDAGRREFEAAARIHPTNLAARFGVGEYFERQENYASALLEYGKLEAEFPNHPILMGRIARCYKQMRRWDKAWSQYVATVNRFIELGASPTEEIYFDIGYIAWNVQRDKSLAIPFYADYLAYHGDSPRAYQVHLLLGDLFRDEGNSGAGIAYGHLSRARTLNPESDEIREALEKRPLRPLSIPDIGVMLNQYGYHPSVVADIVLVTKLNIALDPENEQHVRLLQEHKIPMIVVRAILTSNQRQGTAQALPGQAPQAQQPAAQQPVRIPEPPDMLRGDAQNAANAQTAGPPAAVQALVGTWKGNTSIVFMKYELTLTFNANGQYTLASHDLNEGTTMTTVGTFSTTGAVLKTVTEEGNRMESGYQIAGNRLVLQRVLGYIRPITFTKQ